MQFVKCVVSLKCRQLSLVASEKLKCEIVLMLLFPEIKTSFAQ